MPVGLPEGYPITVAGPCRSFTGFPILPQMGAPRAILFPSTRIGYAGYKVNEAGAGVAGGSPEARIDTRTQGRVGASLPHPLEGILRFWLYSVLRIFHALWRRVSELEVVTNPEENPIQSIDRRRTNVKDASLFVVSPSARLRTGLSNYFMKWALGTQSAFVEKHVA